MGSSILRLGEERIVEAWHAHDALGPLRDLGQILPSSRGLDLLA
jgi:hypothetical protein